LGQINHCTVHVKKIGDLEKKETSAFQDLAEKLGMGLLSFEERLGEEKKKGE
jgi:hypothetical protein